MPLFRQQEQYPLNAVGPKGQHAFIGTEKIFFTGTTGGVGTAYGIPGVTVARTGTGTYSITYPVAHEVDIIPGLQCPTGHSYQATIVQNNPTSGTARLNITRHTVSTGHNGGVGITNTVVMHNPVSGTIASLLFVVSPVTRY